MLGPCMASTVCGRNYCECETYLFLRVALYCSQPLPQTSAARPTKRAAATSFRYRPLYFRRELAVLCRELESCTIFFVSPPPLLCCIARKERLPGFDFGLSPPSPDETEGKRAWDLHHQTIFSVLSWLAIVQGNTVVWTAVTCFGARGVGKEAEEEQQAASPRSPMGSRRREMGRRRKIIANTGAKRESVMTQGKTVFGCTQEASF